MPDRLSNRVRVERIEAVLRSGVVERFGDRLVRVDEGPVEVQDQAERVDDYSCAGATGGGQGREPSVAPWRFRLKRP